MPTFRLNITGVLTPHLLNIRIETSDIKPNGVVSEDLAKALGEEAA